MKKKTYKIFNHDYVLTEWHGKYAMELTGEETPEAALELIMQLMLEVYINPDHLRRVVTRLELPKKKHG